MKDTALIIGLGKMNKGTDMRQLCVPASMLGVESEEGMTEPAAGDLVDFNVSAKVDRVDGGKAYVTVNKVNGSDIVEAKEEIPDPAKKEDDKPSEDKLLRDAAAEEDANSMGY